MNYLLDKSKFESLDHRVVGASCGRPREAGSRSVGKGALC